MADAPLRLPEEEYRALRATIRERGTVRPIVMVLTVMSWAVTSIWLQVSGGTPLLTLVALVILDAGFEAVFTMHVGVERIGRYLQVRYESPDGPRWEHTAMEPPAPARSGPVDGLFSRVFLVATGLNVVLACWLAVAVSPVAQAADVIQSAAAGGRVAADLTWSTGSLSELLLVIAVIVAHALFVARVFGAKKFSAGQRERDLAFFRKGLGEH